YTDSNLLELSTYHYRVTAFNLAGTGEPSAVLSVTTPMRPASSHNFITEWRMPADDLTLTFRARGSYTINWGDGTEQEITSNNPTHTYATAGDYIITASNTITRIQLNNFVDARQLIDVQQWGSANWTSMSSAFSGASAMTMSASDNPDLSGVAIMTRMFAGASAFNGDIGGWNVANVTNMNNMFENASAFNQDIGDWNVGEVRSMNFMFNTAIAFNQDISGWNVARVTNMNNVFLRASAFSQNLGRWYIDETVDDLQTANPNYDSVNDLSVLSFNFVAQNAVLSGQTPTYRLATGGAAEGSDNARFTLASNTLSFRSGEAIDGTYTVRIAVGSVSYGSGNSVDLTVVVDLFPTVTSIVRTSPTEQTTNVDTLVWTVTFSKNVQNVDASDFSLSGTTATAIVTGSGAEYQVSVTGGDLAVLNGTVTLAFA
ncbi:MAG: BspA family leucine-rich repeat surface protein, partial [Methylococcales symbiont of Iophon sp. n. MRB-2018]